MTRSASDLGRGLLPARAARPIRPAERIHVVGVAGAGASAAALLAHAAGAIVSGCDPGGPTPYSVALEAAGIPLAWAHDPGHVATDPPPDRLAVTKALTSIDPDNAELAAARQAGIATEPWQQVVADAAFGKTLVAIAGTHGKSTTAGWLTHVLVSAGLDPSAFVGALLPASIAGDLPATARLGAGDVFVVEADEYAGNFDAFRPDVVGLTNLDWDHPDLFADRAAVVTAVGRWLAAVPEAVLVANVGDDGSRELLATLPPGRRVVRTLLRVPEGAAAGSLAGPSPVNAGVVEAAILEAAVDHTTIEIRGLGAEPGEVTNVRLSLVGAHNAADALVVAGVSRALGLDAEVITAGLASFPGVGRRLERKGDAGGVVVYDDYGHHPTAIRATLAAVRQREPGRRIWAAYEPLTYHRTAALLPEFAAVLATADGVAIADIWAGRDPDTSVASSAALAAATRSARPTIVAEAPGSVDATAAWLAEHVEPGDAVLVMGGGRSYRIAEVLLERLAERVASTPRRTIA